MTPHDAASDRVAARDSLTPAGYRLWACCPCGSRYERWVTGEAAEADLLRSALLAFEN